MNYFLDVISLAIALIAIILSYLSFFKNYVRSIKPVLVFLPDCNDQWSVKNVGNGPAINILITGSDAVSDDLNNIPWNCNQTCSIPSINCNEKLYLNWNISRMAFLTIYSDMSKKEYSSICQENKHSFFDKNISPTLEPQIFLWQLKELSHNSN